jgi:hypothetical protein
VIHCMSSRNAGVDGLGFAATARRRTAEATTMVMLLDDAAGEPSVGMVLEVVTVADEAHS